MSDRIVKVPLMDECSFCHGYGMQHGIEGDVVDCGACGGSGAVEARDARGRFLPWNAYTVPQGPTGEPDDDRPF